MELRTCPLGIIQGGRAAYWYPGVIQSCTAAYWYSECHSGVVELRTSTLCVIQGQ